MESDELFARRAGSFGADAAAYAEHRPDYPADGIRWVLSGAARPVRRVLDLAAGTGKLTGGLLALGLEVTAVEPDPAMRAELSRRFPEVPALPGTAERMELPDGSVDAVLVGQAFHWFDRARALTEIARVLRPGGVVGGLWNHEEVGVEWVAGLVLLSRTSASRRVSFDNAMPSHPAFEPFERAEFPHAHRRTAESLTATVGTHSHTRVIPAAERSELLARVRAYLDARPETAHGEFELPLRTTVERARRRS
ncbi:MAG TPA: class I SAM-dependent methyltransferase [Actinophytocola sp.]|uniref:class I SAM-dependent methyltransferase n=1 Tax=Actinophytocola sp. TaxID=1872138 RepID=UPI002DDD2DE9|nr:class I SAM-dependent methyltransferase [Actinophytocola sp.]HEV2782656.1 class I SAM-dependent methyltransferase [Actinophytocola sp.]